MRPSAVSIRAPRWLVAGTAILFIVHLLITWGRWVPVIAPDEIGPIAIARYIAGAAPMMHLEGTPHMSFGLGLLLAPGYALLPAPYWTYKLAIVLNCLWAALVLPIAWAIAKRFDGHRAAAAALLTALYPALWIQSQYAWNEVALMCGFLALCWLLLQVLERTTWWRLLSVVVLAAFLYALHERAIAIPILTAGFLAIVAWQKAGPAPRLLVFAAVVLVLAGAVYQGDLYFWSKGWADGRGVTVGSLAANVDSPAAWKALGTTVLLQFWYLVAASAGLVLLAVPVLWRCLRRAPGAERMQLFAGFLALTSMVMLAASSLTMLDPLRADQYLYGRYNEALILPWICLGTISAGSLRWRGLAYAVGVTVVVTAFAFLFADVRNWEYLLPFNVSGVASYFLWLRGSSAFLAGAALVIATLTCVCLLARHSRWYALAPAVVFAAVVITTLPMTRKLNAAVTSRITLGRTLLPTLPSRQLGYDMGRLPRFLYYHLQALLPHKDVVAFDEKPAASTTLVISNDDWTTSRVAPAWCSIGREPHSQIVYWVRQDGPMAGACGK